MVFAVQEFYRVDDRAHPVRDNGSTDGSVGSDRATNLAGASLLFPTAGRPKWMDVFDAQAPEHAS
jgi:hypothetical protein